MKSVFKYTLALSICLFYTACTKNDNKLETQQHKDSSMTVQRKLNVQKLYEILNMKSTENKGEYKVTVPQNDLNVIVDGFRITPPMGLSSWAAFSPMNNGAMLMGDIIVGENELAPVEKIVIEHGLEVTAIHNHFLRNKPNYMYMHIGGMGSEEKLAESVKAVFDKIKELRGTDPSSIQAPVVTNTLDTAALVKILGHSGEMSNGVYKITIGRPDVDLKEDGIKVSTFMGFNTWAAWQGTPERAAVAGDFVMLENEVDGVITALVQSGIEVVALHNHMLNEDPRVFFLHYWGIGSAEKLANGLKAALDKTNLKTK